MAGSGLLRSARFWRRAGFVLALAAVAVPWVLGRRWGLPSPGRNALYFRHGVRPEDVPSVPEGPDTWRQYPNWLPGARRAGEASRSAFNALRTYHPDEYVILKGLRNMDFPRLDLFPGLFAWPPLHFYVVGAALGAAAAVGVLDADAEHRSLEYFFRHPKDLARWYLVGRVVTLLFALLAVWAVWRIGDLLYEPPAGFICALFLAVTPAFSYHAGFLTADVPALAWALVATLCAALAMREGRMLWYILGGVFVGLAAATRYQGAACALSVIGGHLCGHNEAHRPWAKRLFDARLWLAGGAAVVVFLAINPFVISRAGFLQELASEAQGGRWPDVGRGEALRHFLSAGLGLPLSLFAAVGLAFMLLRNVAVGVYREDCFVLIAYLPVAAVLLAGRPAMVRYLFPALPLATLCAGLVGTELIVARPAQRDRRLLALGITAVAVVAAAAWMHSMAYASLRRGLDPRNEAGKWIRDHVPEGASIGVIEDPWQFRMPPLDARVYRILVLGQDPQRLESLAPEWVVVSDFHRPPLALRGPLDEREEAFWHALRSGGKYGTAAVFARLPRFAGVTFGTWRDPHDMRYLNPRIVIFRARPAPARPAQ